MIKGKESVQFLVNPDIGLIDGNVSEYVLYNEFARMVFAIRMNGLSIFI